MNRIIVAAVVMVALFFAAAAYYRLGWSRMEAACSANLPGSSAGWRSIEYSFTAKSGFTCRFDDGSIRSSWWPA